MSLSEIQPVHFSSIGILIGVGTKLRVFGSSANNFGSDEADLDMCLTFPKGTSLVNLTSPVQSHGNGEMEQQSQGGLTPSVVIEGLAQQLTDMGMSDVRPHAGTRGLASHSLDWLGNWRRAFNMI